MLIFSPHLPVTLFLFWFGDAALPQAVHISGTTGGVGTSEHLTLFKFKKLHASVLKYLKCTELRCPSGESQPIAALMKTRFSSR